MRPGTIGASVLLGCAAAAGGLALGYSLARGQASHEVVTAFAAGGTYAITANGDIWNVPSGAPFTVGQCLFNLFSGTTAQRVVGAANCPGMLFCAVTENGDVWAYEPENGSQMRQYRGNVFGGASGERLVAAVENESYNSYMFCFTADGDVWVTPCYSAPFRSWYYGNIFGTGPVPAEPTTWGRVKAERR